MIERLWLYLLPRPNLPRNPLVKIAIQARVKITHKKTMRTTEAVAMVVTVVEGRKNKNRWKRTSLATSSEVLGQITWTG
jgi:hypothetical protein